MEKKVKKETEVKEELFFWSEYGVLAGTEEEAKKLAKKAKKVTKKSK